MNTDQIYNSSLELLGRLLQEAYSHSLEKAVREHFVYQHARAIWNVAQDLMCLNQHNRVNSVFILIRPLFESLFNLAAAVNNPLFVSEKHIAELEYNRTRLEKWVEFDGNDTENPFADTIQALSTLAEQLRRMYSINNKKKWTSLDVAKEAKLDHHYVKEYFMFSQNTHASIAGLIA